MEEKLIPTKLASVPYLLDNGREQYINPVMKNVRPYLLTIDESGGDSKAVISAEGTSDSIVLTNNSNGVLDLRYLLAKATSDEYLVKIHNAEKSLDYMNRDIHAKCCLGQSGLPFKLDHPIILDKKQVVRLSITDLSGSENTIRVAFKGNLYDFDNAYELVQGLSHINKKAMPYWYTTDSNIELPASSAETTKYITLSKNDKFFLTGIICHSDDEFKFKITESGKGVAWMNGWIHSDMIGSAQNRVNIEPQLVEDKLRIQLVNLAPSATNSVYITLCGIVIAG